MELTYIQLTRDGAPARFPITGNLLVPNQFAFKISETGLPDDFLALGGENVTFESGDSSVLGYLVVRDRVSLSGDSYFAGEFVPI